MNSTVKIGLIGLGGLAVGFVIAKCLGGEKKKDKKKDNKQPKKLVVKKDNVAKRETTSNGFPLKLGSHGNKVKRLQVYLMRKLGVVRKPTGEFDQITLKRVKAWFKTETVSKQVYDKLMLDKMVHDQRKVRRNGSKR